MARQTSSTASGGQSPGDPWHAVGHLVAGVGLYGLAGWGLDRWLGTSWLVVVGILLGAVLGTYLTWARFRPGAEAPPGGPGENL